MALSFVLRKEKTLMNMPNVSKFIKKTKRMIGKHNAEILTGIGIGGMITTTVLAVKATPKAIRLLDERKRELKTEKLPGGEIVKTTWKCYAPSVLLCAASTTCLIGASATNYKRNAALATAYKISEAALVEYKEKVIETIGVDKEAEIRDAVIKDNIDKHPVKTNEIIITGGGETLCLDVQSGRYFRSDIDKIEKSVNKVNKQIIDEGYISLNEFYYELGLDGTGMGAKLGWNLNNGLVEIYPSAQLSEKGEPCLAIDYDNPPIYGFDMLS